MKAVSFPPLEGAILSEPVGLELEIPLVRSGREMEQAALEPHQQTALHLRVEIQAAAPSSSTNSIEGIPKCISRGPRVNNQRIAFTGFTAQSRAERRLS